AAARIAPPRSTPAARALRNTSAFASSAALQSLHQHLRILRRRASFFVVALLAAPADAHPKPDWRLLASSARPTLALSPKPTTPNSRVPSAPRYAASRTADRTTAT